MAEAEYERVATVCNKMFSYKKSTTVLLSSDIPKNYKNRQNTDPIFLAKMTLTENICKLRLTKVS